MTTEITAGRRFNRRAALSYVGLGVVGLFVAFELRRGSDSLENIRRASLSIVKAYLEDDLKSDRDDNLSLFSTLGKTDFVKAVQERNKDLISEDPEINMPARWDISKIIFQDILKIAAGSIEEERFSYQILNFIQDTAGQIDKNLILNSKPEIQASMWTEAILRSYSFMGRTELPRPDGVTTVQTKSLMFGDGGIQFFRLQDHSSVRLLVK